MPVFTTWGVGRKEQEGSEINAASESLLRHRSDRSKLWRVHLTLRSTADVFRGSLRFGVLPLIAAWAAERRSRCFQSWRQACADCPTVRLISIRRAESSGERGIGARNYRLNRVKGVQVEKPQCCDSSSSAVEAWSRIARSFRTNCEEFQDGKKNCSPLGPNLKGLLMFDANSFSFQMIGGTALKRQTPVLGVHPFS